MRGFYWIGFFMISLGLSGCWKSEYTKMVEQELATGSRNDSLFLGLHFGMTKKEFFNHCAALNKKKLTTMGRNANVLYKIENPVGSISMNFYPDFHNDSIYQIPVIFTYDNWTPWIRNTQPDSLQERIKRLFEQWYGEGFISVEKDRKKNEAAFVKVDGNRQIIIFCEGEMDVKAVFTDLLVQDKIKK